MFQKCQKNAKTEIEKRSERERERVRGQRKQQQIQEEKYSMKGFLFPPDRSACVNNCQLSHSLLPSSWNDQYENTE